MATNKVMQTYLENILNIPTGDTVFLGSTYEQELLNQAYFITAERYNWTETLIRDADIIVANVDRYALPTRFNKFAFLFIRGTQYKEVALDDLPFEKLGYSVVRDVDEYIVNSVPTTASTAYTMTNSETAGDAVVVELDTVSGLSTGSQIWVDGTTTDEFTIVQSVDTANKTITIKLANNQSANDILYLVNELNYFGYYREIATLSADGDTPILPTPIHLVIPHYAAYLYLLKIEDSANAALNLQTWKTELSDYWFSRRKNSTGQLSQFRI